MKMTVIFVFLMFYLCSIYQAPKSYFTALGRKVIVSVRIYEGLQLCLWSVRLDYHPSPEIATFSLLGYQNMNFTIQRKFNQHIIPDNYVFFRDRNIFFLQKMI